LLQTAAFQRKLELLQAAVFQCKPNFSVTYPDYY